MKHTITLTGKEAIEYAIWSGVDVNVYATPISDAVDGVDPESQTVRDAFEADPSLVWVDRPVKVLAIEHFDDLDHPLLTEIMETPGRFYELENKTLTSDLTAEWQGMEVGVSDDDGGVVLSPNPRDCDLVGFALVRGAYLEDPTWINDFLKALDAAGGDPDAIGGSTRELLVYQALDVIQDELRDWVEDELAGAGKFVSFSSSKGC